MELLRRDGFDASVATDLDTAIPEAEIISCATLSATPLVRGALLTTDSTLDLVGALRPDMRQADGGHCGVRS